MKGVFQTTARPFLLKFCECATPRWGSSCPADILLGSKVGKIELWEQMLHPTTTTQCYANHFWLWSINKASLSHTRHWAMAHGPSGCKRNPWSSFGSRLGPLVWAPLWTQEKQIPFFFPSVSFKHLVQAWFLEVFPPGSAPSTRLV